MKLGQVTFMNLIFAILGSRVALSCWSRKMNRFHFVIISTSMLITSISAEYLWPTTMKRTKCLLWTLFVCLFGIFQLCGAGMFVQHL